MQDAGKRDAGARAADLVRDGTVLGLGTGSTVFFAVERLRSRIAEGLDLVAVPTSYQAAMRAREAGIPLTTLDEHPEVDATIDGADQVDGCLRLIKGRGAAHTREKCVAAASARLFIAVDPSKMVGVLTGPIPVEVLPFACKPVMARIAGLGGEGVLREGLRKDGPVITDNGNFVLDARFGAISDPEHLEAAIEAIPGVVAAGLFTGFTERTTVLVGEKDGVRILGRQPGL
ncbi:MAG: ribose-5-phosphate isomerase RpiA [Methanoregulaceae archaeon]|nr:ribose-5-phosphate isomerase RpiA [Methanoregulaceae archaeon]